ncbi:hypothetical protein VCHA39O224_110113 [Vibrio chagasii]|nr:hypothetical protein VCHA39O224_110113 [Vibrio chagasii]
MKKGAAAANRRSGKWVTYPLVPIYLFSNLQAKKKPNSINELGFQFN